MPINETILEEPATNLTSQIGEMFSGTYKQLLTEAEPVELGESFDVWRLDPNAIQQGIASHTFPAYKTNSQHHQILVGDKPSAYALSEKQSLGPRRVVSVALSGLAERVDKAIQELESKPESSLDTEARFMVIQPWRVYAFWLVDRDRVYVVSAPSHYKNLHPGQKMTTSEFLHELNEEIGPVLLRESNRE